MLLCIIKVLFCLFLYTGEVCYLIPEAPCIQRVAKLSPKNVTQQFPKSVLTPSHNKTYGRWTNKTGTLKI
jgi:hypothetical protein